MRSFGLHGSPALLLVILCLLPATNLAGEVDRTRYMSPDEVRAGMKGYGRTVMSGSRIDTFEFEVIGVMRNAYYAKQDVILVRCSGLNLEHSGIIGGMSGSPCYVRLDDGGERMIGAVAYGWNFNKDPICGVQPITQMLPISDVRTRMKEKKPSQGPTASAPSGRAAAERGGGHGIAELLARSWGEPVDEGSRLSIFNNEIRKLTDGAVKPEGPREQLRPLLTPVMVSGGAHGATDRFRDRFERLGLTPVASGAASAAAAEEARGVKLEPGSVLCIPFMRGDIMMEGLGTCTEVIGDRVLGFGHSMFGEGEVELPLATGIVHTVIPSVMRSNKIGAAIETVGTLKGDENSGVFGVSGPAPRMIPLEVVVKDLRGTQTYNYELVQEQNFTPMLLGTAALESVYAHNEPPKEHTIRYSLETEFENLGTFRSTDFTSQTGVMGIAMDAAVPTSALMNAPFAKAKVVRARMEISVEEGARLAYIDQVRALRTLRKPGDKVTVRVRWRHYRQEPLYTEKDYELALPADLPDGDYNLTVGSTRSYLSGLQTRRPHLFRADSLPELLEGFNLLSSAPSNRLYLSLDLPTGGVAVDRTEMPQLPSFRRQLLASTARNDLHRYSDSLTAHYDTDFAVSGSQVLKITVSRRADQ